MNSIIEVMKSLNFASSQSCDFPGFCLNKIFLWNLDVYETKQTGKKIMTYWGQKSKVIFAKPSYPPKYYLFEYHLNAYVYGVLVQSNDKNDSPSSKKT